MHACMHTHTFKVLAWDRAMGVWASAKYWGHIVTAAAFAVTTVLPSPKKDKAEKKKQ